MDSEQFNSSGGDDDKLSTINIAMSTSEPQLTQQSIENLNNLFTDEQYYDGHDTFIFKMKMYGMVLDIIGD